MERVSQWLTQAIAEGHFGVEFTPQFDRGVKRPRGGFRARLPGLCLQNSLSFHVTVDGRSRDIHPIVRDEIYRIGYEAIRNACLHSGANELSVSLDYRDGLIVRVRDNGKGMDPDATSSGKAGHFGIPGMYERAARIHNKLTIEWSWKRYAGGTGGPE